MKIKTMFFGLFSALSALSVPASAIEKEDLTGLKVIDESLQEKATSCVIMSENMEGSEHTHKLRAFLSLLNKDSKNAVEVNPFIHGRKLCLSGLDFGTNYLLTIKKGLKAASGNSVVNDFSMEFKSIDSKPVVAFNHGLILSTASEDKKISIETVNMDSFKVSLFSLSDKSIESGSLYSNLEENLDHYELSRLINNFSKFEKSVIVKTEDKKNIKQFTTLNLKDFKTDIKKGMYLMVITKDDGVTDYENSYTLLGDYGDLSVGKIVMLSDLGVTTYKSDMGIDVAVRSIETAKATAGAEVSLISTSNQILKTVVSDNNGFAHFDKKIISGKDGMAPHMIRVRKGDDFYNMALKYEGLYLEDKFVEGDYQNLNTDYRIYSYANRSFVRPGEKVYFNVLMRNKDLSAAPVKAVKVTVRRPNYSKFDEVTLTKNKSGSFEYEMTVPMSNSLGTWEISLDNGERYNFEVQSIKPSSINLKFDESKTVVKGDDKVNLNVNYNYGSPARKLHVSGNLKFVPDNHPVDAYKDFYFGIDTSSDKDYSELSYVNDLLTDDNGTVSFCPGFKDKDYPQKFTISADVNDPSSALRSVKHDYKLYFSEPVIGIKAADVDENGSKFEVVYANQEGKSFKTSANYSIYKKIITYQFVKNSNRWEYVKNDYLLPVTSGSVQTDEGKTGEFTVALEDGLYTIELQNENTKTTYTFYQGNRLNQDANTPDRFTLLTDKEEYKAGDNAVLSFESESDGYADLVTGLRGVETLTHHTVVKGHNEIVLPVTKEMGTGTYVLLSLYAPQNNAIKTSLRSIGLNYIKVNMDEIRLNVSSDAPDLIKPNSKFSFNVKVDNADDSTYVNAFLVDNGILNLHNEKAPDPLKALTSRKSFKPDIIDIYEYIMSEVKSQSQGYGDESSDGMDAMSLSNVLNRMLSLYEKSVKVENGTAKIDFDIPNLSGSAKLMVVAWSDKKLGSFSKDITLADNTVVTLSTPYYLHTEDKLKSKISLRNELDKDRTYTVNVSCKDAVNCEISKQSVNVKAKEENSLEIELNGAIIGNGSVDLEVNDPEYSYKDSFELEVLPSSDPVLETRIVHLNPHEAKEVKLDNTYLEDAQAKVSIGTLPLCDIAELTEVAKQSCEFNIYSKAANLSTLLYSLKSSNEKGSDEYKSIEKLISDKVSELNSYFIQRGSLSYEITDYDEIGYATAYTVKALIEADKMGFNVDRQMLDKSLEYLNSLISSDDECTAALSMYVLASNGINVQSNLSYRFDHNTIIPVSALADYANTFALYGDVKRQDEALQRALKSLERMMTLISKINETYDSKNLFPLLNKLREFEPFFINTPEYELLTLIRASLQSNNSLDIASLYGDLERYSIDKGYLSPESAAVLADLYDRFGIESSTQGTEIVNNAVNVENNKETAAVATVNVSGYIAQTTDLKKQYKDYIINQKFFTEDGIELRTPLSLKLNEKIITVFTFASAKPLKATVFIKNKIPSNMVLMHEIDGEEAENAYPFIKDLSSNTNTSIYDESVVKQFNLYNQSTIKVAYLLKAAYAGHSEALMSTVKLKNAVLSDLKYLNKKHSIEVLDNTDTEEKSASDNKKK